MISIMEREQFSSGFVAVNPNSKIPALLDCSGPEPIRVFESGAILVYLAEKTGKFLPGDLRGRFEVLQWLFWQMAGLGPMAGQNHHFAQYAPEKLAYAIDRYVNETSRLYAVLDKRLADREFVAGNYSIADMAAYPWIVPHERQKQNLDDFSEPSAGSRRSAPPAVVRPRKGKTINTQADRRKVAQHPVRPERRDSGR
jgi:GST-like protein